MDELIRNLVAIADEADLDTPAIDMLRAFRDGDYEGTGLGVDIAVELANAGVDARDVIIAMQANEDAGEMFNE